MNRRTRKILISIILFGLFIFAVHILVQLTIDINYSATLETKYNKTIDTERHLIETRWATLETPDNWRNLVHSQTCPGYVGGLWTGKGMIDYEYGYMAPVYSDNQDFTTVTDTINDLIIEISRKGKLTALHLPQQKEMTGGLTFYASETSTRNFNTLMEIIQTMKFEK
ncbi:hypothetical protein Oweho_2879 [Owenweeksia hongkongensis DSM 17368]|uniref:Uncharacterized protein n=1 Tax=Owenweeksia hongkongensis (strain DSM 17368 / CIP 108786 / JCM 12287 / NRRL B-23963 / UST20020801) TaxID=926562 RepID=G8R194_OWEHD|nr:hypothetical protein [Owenweeksia hongkongensis]AEV33837.1 hypothetical protein Oweho_2879 [Owenweeksia hongkongensis DSM 17368]